MGNLRPKSEVDESEPDEEITNATTKVGTKTIIVLDLGLVDPIELSLFVCRYLPKKTKIIYIYVKFLIVLF